MRKIQFKVWDTKNKKFLEDVPMVEEWIDSDSWDDPEEILNDPYLWQMAETYGGRLIWLQFTGLKDKNEKEIYEDDILRWFYGDYEEPVISTVTYSNETASFDIPIDRNGERIVVEIIGNIYENTDIK